MEFPMAKKRFISFLCVLGLLFSLLSLGILAAKPMSETNQFRMLFTSKVRSGPGTTYSAIGTTQEGSIELGYSSSASYSYSTNHWTRIYWNSSPNGYVRNDLTCPDTFIYKVTASSVNIRAGIGTTSTVIDSLPSGAYVERVDKNTYSGSGYTWYRVRIRTDSDSEGSVGYVVASYISAGY